MYKVLLYLFSIDCSFVEFTLVLLTQNTAFSFFSSTYELCKFADPEFLIGNLSY